MESIASKNIWYASVSIIVPSIFTYIFWFLAARVGGTEPVGVASSIASLVIIVSTIAGLDMSLGMKRMMGLAISSGNISEFRQILVSTVIFVTLIITASSALILVPEFGILKSAGIDQQYALMIVAMIFAQSFQIIFIEAIIAALLSKKLVLPLLLGSLARFPIFFAAYYVFNALTIGIVFAFSSLLFISSFCFGFYLIKITGGRLHGKTKGNFYYYVRNTIRAGLASWIPHTLNVAGYWLGIIVVFASEGASDGGKFYITIGIFTVTLFVVTGITKVIHAMVPRLHNEKAKVTYLVYYIDIAFIFTMPFAVPLLFFSSNFLGLMGEEFSSASGSMAIFILSLPFVIICEMVYYFAYGNGDHRSVLILGLMGNIPRIVLYFLLSPFLGIDGAAISFFIGSILQFVGSLKFANRCQISIDAPKYFVLTLIPILVGVFLWIISLDFVISSIVIITSSFILYIRFQLVTSKEIRDMVFTVLPTSLANQVYPYFSRMISIISSKK